MLKRPDPARERMISKYFAVDIVDVAAAVPVDVIRVVEGPAVDEMAGADQVVDARIRAVAAIEALHERVVDLQPDPDRYPALVTVARGSRSRPGMTLPPPLTW